jgi:large subunit ribosomal protein L10
MPTEQKRQQVAEIQERLTRTVMAIGLDYRGLSVAQMRDLRLALRAQEPSMELRVVKNTLLKLAAQNAGKPGVIEITNEATALVLGYEEEVAPPKALKKYLRESRLTIPIWGGFLDGAVLSAAEVDDLASVPTRMESMANLAGGINGPVGAIAGAIHAILRDVAATVHARAEQLAADAPPEAAAPAQAEAEAETAPEAGDTPQAEAPEAASDAATGSKPATPNTGSGEGHGDDAGTDGAPEPAAGRGAGDSEPTNE